MESCGRRLEVECGDAAIQGGHPAEQIAFAGFALCSQATGFRLDFLRLLDPLGRESVVPQKSMSHAIGGIFKWILAEVEWFAGAFQVVERALLHSLANPAIGNELKDIHETSLAARRSAQLVQLSWVQAPCPPAAKPPGVMAPGTTDVCPFEPERNKPTVIDVKNTRGPSRNSDE